MTASTQIDEYIHSLPDWQASNCTAFRALIHKLEPAVTEDWKWSVPVFLLNGRLVCAMSGFKSHTKFNFFEGASLADPAHYLNGGLDSKKHRSLDLTEEERIDQKKLSAIIRAAFDLQL